MSEENIIKTDKEDPKIEEEQKMPDRVDMIITLFANGGVQVKFPLLDNRLISYALLKMAEKTLDAHYKKQRDLIIKPDKGNIMNFARNMLKGKK